MDEQIRLMDQVVAAAVDMGMKFGPKVLVAAAILVAGVFAGRWAGRALGRALARFRLEPPVMALTERAAQILVLGLFVIMALQNLGVELLPLIAGLSIAGAGVALAMQGVLGNAVAGLTIIVARPFRVGDYISIVKEEGEVLEIKLFSSVLGHADRSRVVIPNRKIVGEILHNYGKVRQLALEVGIAYGSDVDGAIAAIRAALAANPRVLKDPAPAVAVAKLADSSLRVAVGPWVSVADYVPATGELNQAILNALRGARVEIPVPQREIRMAATASAYVGRKEGEAYAGNA